MHTGSAPPFLMFYCFTRFGPRLAAPAKSAKRLLSVGREGPRAPRARAGVPSTPDDVAAPRDGSSEPTSRGHATRDDRRSHPRWAVARTRPGVRRTHTQAPDQRKGQVRTPAHIDARHRKNMPGE